MVPPIARVIRASSACIRIFYGTAYDNPGYPWPWPANDFIGSDCCANGRHSSFVFCRNGATRVPTKMSALFSSARQKCRNRSFLFSSLRVCVFFFFLLLLLFFRLCVQKSGTPRLLSIYDCVYDYWLFGAPSSPFYGIFRRGADHFSETFLLCQVRSVMGLSKSWLQYWMIFSIWSAISQCLQLLLKVKVQYTISSKTNYHSRFTNCTLKSSLCAHN